MNVCIWLVVLRVVSNGVERIAPTELGMLLIRRQEARPGARCTSLVTE